MPNLVPDSNGILRLDPQPVPNAGGNAIDGNFGTLSTLVTTLRADVDDIELVPGPQGPQGPQGATGAQGPQGNTGATGATGAAGVKGDKGDKGDTGNTGAAGPSGVVTASGTAPLSLSYNSGTQAISGSIDLSAYYTSSQADTLLLAKAPLASAALTGTPTAPTPSTSDNSTKIATTAYVDARITSLINGAPSSFDTLQEIAGQLATDGSALSALTTTVGNKLAKASNLSDLSNVATARSNLGLGTAAQANVGTGNGQVVTYGTSGVLVLPGNLTLAAGGKTISGGGDGVLTGFASLAVGAIEAGSLAAGSITTDSILAYEGITLGAGANIGMDGGAIFGVSAIDGNGYAINVTTGDSSVPVNFQQLTNFNGQPINMGDGDGVNGGELRVQGGTIYLGNGSGEIGGSLDLDGGAIEAVGVTIYDNTISLTGDAEIATSGGMEIFASGNISNANSIAFSGNGDGLLMGTSPIYGNSLQAIGPNGVCGISMIAEEDNESLALKVKDTNALTIDKDFNVSVLGSLDVNSNNVTGVNQIVNPDNQPVYNWEGGDNQFFGEFYGNGGSLTGITATQVGLSNVPNLNTSPGKVGLVIDGGGAVLATGSRGPTRVQQNCTITGWYIDADVSTTSSVGVYVNGSLVSASAPITVTAGTTNSSTTLTGWTTSLTKGDAVTFNLTANNNAKRVTLTLMVVTR